MAEEEISPASTGTTLYTLPVERVFEPGRLRARVASGIHRRVGRESATFSIAEEVKCTACLCLAGQEQPQKTRGRYAKFNGPMDVVLLEALLVHNPFTAKHGTRLQMWQNVAESVGTTVFKSSNAFSWHTCRCVQVVRVLPRCRFLIVRLYTVTESRR
jgi:hypothetical protein